MALCSKNFFNKLNTLDFFINSSCDFAQNIIFKAPCRLNDGVCFCNCYCGAFSYIFHTTVCKNTYIGNYCSISAFNYLGASNQKLALAATSPIFLDSTQMAFAGYTSYTMHLDSVQNKTGNEVVFVGNDVWIGTHVKICAGLKIGDGAVIGSGAVVTKDVPPYAIVVDQDRILRYRFSDELISDLLETQWWQYDIPLMAKQGLKIPAKDPRQMVNWLKHTPKEKLIPISKNAYHFFVKDSQDGIYDLPINKLTDSQIAAFFKALQNK